MGKIRILDQHTANQIAAGEVIERPASIVKELLENAMDAGARSVHIAIRQGGLESIRVTDDGSGMDPEDMERAFLRYATSKIQDAQDLYALETMGFRGEALSSIAAVSRVSLSSRLRDEARPGGYRIDLEGGDRKQMVPVPLPPGTRVEVRDLFFNTPARSKFLRAEHLETRAITDLTQKLALARPDIAVVLEADGRTLVRTPGTGELADACAGVLPGGLADRLVPIGHQGEYLRIEGLLGPSELHRSSRDLEVFFVNRRYVRSPFLSGALEAAFRHRIPARRFPVAILHLAMHPAAVDVNIHPAKREVKFSMEKTIGTELTAAVTGALRAGEDRRFSPAAQEAVPGAPRGGPGPRKEKTGPPVRKRPPEVPPQGPARLPFGRTEPPVVREEGTPPDAPETPGRALHPVFTDLEYLGSVQNTYLLFRHNEDLCILDQHAAHERLRFEALEDRQEKELATQLLLEPVPLVLTQAQEGKLIEGVNTLADAGVLVEYQGDGFSLRGVPAAVTGLEGQELIETVLEEEHGPGEIRRRLLALAACRGAVRSGDPLHPSAVRALLDDLSRARDPYTCPHGRPTLITLGDRDLARLFLRN